MCHLNYGDAPDQIHGPADPTPEQAAYWQLLRLQDAYSCSCRAERTCTLDKAADLLAQRAAFREEFLAAATDDADLTARIAPVNAYDDVAARVLLQRAFWDSTDPGLQADLERLAGVTA